MTAANAPMIHKSIKTISIQPAADMLWFDTVVPSGRASVALFLKISGGPEVMVGTAVGMTLLVVEGIGAAALNASIVEFMDTVRLL